MKIILIFTFLMISLIISGVQAEAPLLISYQGYLANDVGDPIDGLVNINFAIYGSIDGADLLWESGSRKVLITEGLFSVQLGAVTSLPDDLFVGSESRYLGLSVNSGDEISPRTRFTSTGFALQSLRADTALAVENNSITGAGVIDNSLASDDILNMPGIAYTYKSTGVILDDNDPTVIDSITITVPASGYVVVIGKTMIHLKSDSTPSYTLGNARLQLSNSIITDLNPSASSFTGVGYYNNSMGYYQDFTINVCVNDIYQIPSAGTYDYYLFGDQGFNDGIAMAFYTSLVAQYFPVSYGTVEKIIAQPPASDDYETITTVDNTTPEQKTVTGYKVDLKKLELTTEASNK